MSVRTCIVAAALAAAIASPARGSDATVRQTLRAGIAAVQTGDYAARERAVRRTLTRLHAEHASTRAGRRGRSLATAGFTWALRGVRAQLDFVRSDSGEVAAATRDAARADRAWRRGASLLRRAGRALGVRVGLVNGR